ncbi:MAG: glycosyltransferase family 4 protein [Desulfobulbaceae bacterium]|nr:glycosyltransferase family 4 protein [Desulfobulbaceae bacterium]
MKIVQLLPELNQGGVERGTIEFSRELVKCGHQSIVISAGGSLALQIENDGGKHITFDVCSKNPLTVPSRIYKLQTAISKLQPDILHARSRVPAWLTWFANKKLSIPFVTTVHGFNSVNKYSEIMIKGERVIYGSTSIKDYILKNYQIDESILRYVPRGIDMDYFDPAKADHIFMSDFKKKHKLEGCYVITMVGRITEWKGHGTFIRALGEVQKTHPEVVGVVVGGGWHGKEEYIQTLKNLARQNGVEIQFAGSQTKVREIYALSDLVVSAASSRPETFGRTAAEALAMNTPVVASAHGGSLDILLDEENGMFFPPNNYKILSHKLLQALGFCFSNMRQHVENHFSLNRMVEMELAVYNEVIEERAN